MRKNKTKRVRFLKELSLKKFKPYFGYKYEYEGELMLLCLFSKKSLCPDMDNVSRLYNCIEFENVIVFFSIFIEPTRLIQKFVDDDLIKMDAGETLFEFLAAIERENQND